MKTDAGKRMMGVILDKITENKRNFRRSKYIVVSNVVYGLIKDYTNSNLKSGDARDYLEGFDLIVLDRDDIFIEIG